MRPITSMDEMKSIQLDIMQKLHDYCEENRIEYCLSHGSLIGAIRHKGFIPWDDDIDVFMTRDEYNKFCKLFPKDQEKYGLKMVNAFTETYLGRPMTKIIDMRTRLIEPNYLYDDEIGVNVDIWPVDGVLASEESQTKRCNKIKMQINLMYARILKFRACKNSKERLAHLVSLPFAAKKIVYKIDAELSSVPFSTSDKVSCYVDPYKKEFERVWFEKRRLAVFEDRMFYVPEEADKILMVLYGDYMKLPPEEKRQPHHVTNAFWKD